MVCWPPRLLVRGTHTSLPPGTQVRSWLGGHGGLEMDLPMLVGGGWDGLNARGGIKSGSQVTFRGWEERWGIKTEMLSFMLVSSFFFVT